MGWFLWCQIPSGGGCRPDQRWVGQTPVSCCPGSKSLLALKVWINVASYANMDTLRTVKDETVTWFIFPAGSDSRAPGYLSECSPCRPKPSPHPYQSFQGLGCLKILLSLKIGLSAASTGQHVLPQELTFCRQYPRGRVGSSKQGLSLHSFPEQIFGKLWSSDPVFVPPWLKASPDVLAAKKPSRFARGVPASSVHSAFIFPTYEVFGSSCKCW